ncbi:MAG: Zn-ribbon containing protein [Candidatus Nanoarchaeia archaeon]|nr:Zn-ribbon containing protein [Candidatus Nanoarchaeia archaeon]
MSPHRCTNCKKVYPDAAPELLKGCECGSKFFFYIREEKFDELQDIIDELEEIDKIQIEKDIREVTEQKPDEPVILDLESIKIIEPGKFEIDIMNLFSKKRVLVYELEEGKYIIDLATSLKKRKK